MIKIVEKEPYESYDHFNTRDCLMYPNYMIKDGKEYFVVNRTSNPSWQENYDFNRIIEELKNNNGVYTRFYGFYNRPTELLSKIIERKHSFQYPSDKIEKLFDSSLVPNSDISDFHGNLNEVSAAFKYRIYDMEYVEKLKMVVNHIINKDWEKATVSLDDTKSYENNLLENEQSINKDVEPDICD